MDSELERQFEEELAELIDSGRNFAFTLTPSEAWYLFSLLQVQWRHQEVAALPDIGPFVRQFAEKIQGQVCKTPAMAKVAQLGWTAPGDVNLRSP